MNVYLLLDAALKYLTRYRDEYIEKVTKQYDKEYAIDAWENHSFPYEIRELEPLKEHLVPYTEDGAKMRKAVEDEANRKILAEAGVKI